MPLVDSLLLEAYPLDVWIAARADGVKGTGTEVDPWNGSTAARFDDLMANIPANTTVHLGPGTFETKGFGGDGGWQPKSGQRILGSGIDVTILKVVGASIPTRHHWAIGAQPNDPDAFLVGFEASDFTVDCNMAGQTIPNGYDFAPFACGAIFAPGTHVRLRRIRAVNFGTQTAASECFPIITAGASTECPEAVDCVVEDCIVEQPALNNARETSCINMAAGEHNPLPVDPSDADNGIMAYHRGCVVRNCSINCEYQDKPLAIESISIPDGGGVSTVTTRLPHNLSAAQWIRVDGAVVAGAPRHGFDNGYSGSYTVNSINPGGDNRKFTYKPATPVPTTAPTGDMWVGRWPSHYVGPSAVTPSGTSPAWTITVETYTAHFLAVGSAVRVNNVNYPNSSPINGVWVVTEVVDRKKFKYQMTIDPGSVTYIGATYIGVDFQGVGIDAGTGGVMEGNRVFNCRIGGPWHDSYSSKDIIARNNHYRAVVCGPCQVLGGFTGSPPPAPPAQPLRMRASALTHGGAGGLTATLTVVSTKPHGLTVGQGVRIVGAKVGGIPALNTYDGYFAVNSVPSPTSFTYTMLNNPSANADDSPDPELVALWQLRQCVIENNVIELIQTPTAWGTPEGIAFIAGLQDANFAPFRTFRRVVVRNNVIRFVDGITEEFAASLGIDLYYCEDALVENNVVDLANAYPIRHHYCTRVRYFNNTNSAGQLIQGTLEEPPGSGVTPIKQDELTTSVEDAAILTIL